ncbi:hypothetical protein HDU82_001976, partial [Entophlyctis luteolus]
MSRMNLHLVILTVAIELFSKVPLSKVKFNAKQEYEYVTNFKILQTCFDKHKVDIAIPVERLMKCKFQDNLEFLQFVKKHWDTYYPGGTYDALARRGSSSAKSIPSKHAPGMVVNKTPRNVAAIAPAA